MPDARPMKNNRVSNSTLTQYIIAPIIIAVFTRSYELKERFVTLNPSLSWERCLPRVAEDTKQIGVNRANMTGTIMGTGFWSKLVMIDS